MIVIIVLSCTVIRMSYIAVWRSLEGSSGSLRFKNVPIIIFVDFAPYVFHQIRGLSGLDVEDYLVRLFGVRELIAFRYCSTVLSL